MGIAERISGMGQDVKEGIKSTSVFLVALVIRVLTGFFLGLTLGLIGQEVLDYSSFGLIAMILVTLGVFFKISTKWSIAQLLIFDLICVLVGQILRMYVTLAP
ncbi:MAG: hypothetical protein JNM39_04995 [Bdellovibrionaceae bacterium]|nr:hypothetical protein [Pseudobdellovibrionaceae bacterium]